MLILRSFEELHEQSSIHPIFLLGKFDGFHRGHLTLLERALEKKQEMTEAGKNPCLILVTFDRSPQEFFSGQTEAMLMTIKEKMIFLESYPVDSLLLLDFNLSLSQMTSHEFLSALSLPFSESYLILGENSRFGKDQMIFSQWEKNREEYPPHMHLETISLAYVGENPVSSSFLKDKLQNMVPSKEEFAKWKQALGHGYVIYGQVERGNQLGRTIHFPTLNLSFSPHKLYPPFGVYSGYVDYKQKRYKALINISKRNLSKDLKAPLVEAWVDDFHQEIYGEYCTLWVEYWLRNQVAVRSVEELLPILMKDKEALKNL